ncbi:hypothetical protein A2313_01900 [Candidatus Roizmanbacteria bacterium RIFOXYB2_FULL_41_10]|uniref:Cytidyltransferase-like domain-containing protein n=1 Tax=Candidatus Roizmanbacteria bacterium RIFOXYA1_FULL_41_12 TaxID=1802082 RepID=A0A1F7KA63_9BACT|nr:MAG: hypothetical protein A2209_00150 [Candidatus Roizmanbacteria bacterium RIFOXYA1_FULL_41_12]OGK66685.1 MAG: hypothetical protein A2262_03545 [Candidatus Roizmanbacteria bacterium RIFOXYA2_FULL_41_8]OGK67541.1 MAG: hypothetical protein A2377_01705 [Candidatus Roizmanbacteria bacterium RIFOXYB1_FULL_41_27]OGK70947.1 MAG: hypothetical protein A2313_01900 [Candidatus Roizmanbacteria bacterium RIFOXYB2_FULL_41_10]OGK71197.1 MAG: hypothetical protein A2403_00435 [Candidatus Roizmanbacteria bac
MIKKIVLVGGCFDLFHYGHLQFLKAAKKQGNYLVVAVDPDDFILLRKKREPIHTQKQRVEILKNLRFVDQVIALPLLKTYNDYLALVKKIKPAVIAVTAGDPQLKNKQKQAQTVGAKVKVVTPLIKNFSSTSIIAKLDN